MDKEEILNKVLKILALFCELRPEDINMDDRLQSDLYLGETQILDFCLSAVRNFTLIGLMLIMKWMSKTLFMKFSVPLSKKSTV